MSALTFILAGMMAAAMPFLLAALGELIVERSGVLNLGIEGMMALGAAAGFVVVANGWGHGVGFLVAGIAGALLALVFGWLALNLRANQVAAGLAIGILGMGLSSLTGKNYESRTVQPLPKIHLPGLSDLPVIGGLFTQDAVVWLGLLATLAIWAVLRFSRLGLVIRAVGENPRAAHAIGYHVVAIRMAAVAFGGLMAGFAGAYASTVYTPLWADGMIAGRGWIALALVVFATWMTGRVLFGAVLFGAVSLAQYAAQAAGVNLNSQFLASLPQIVTIVVLGIISANKRLLKVNGVASLGEPFER